MKKKIYFTNFSYKVLIACMFITMISWASQSAEAAKDNILNSQATPIASFEGGKAYQQGKIKLVNLQGSWEDMGRQYGYLLAPELQRISTNWIQSFITKHPEKAAKLNQNAQRFVASYPHNFKQFIAGIAQTSG